jgi:hypothetical protein
MSAPIRKKPVTRRSAAKIASSDPNDLKARFEAVTDQVTAEISKASNDMAEAALDAISQSSDVDGSLREVVFMAVALKVLEKFLEGVSDRIRLLIPTH